MRSAAETLSQKRPSSLKPVWNSPSNSTSEPCPQSKVPDKKRFLGQKPRLALSKTGQLTAHCQYPLTAPDLSLGRDLSPCRAIRIVRHDVNACCLCCLSRPFGVNLIHRPDRRPSSRFGGRSPAHAHAIAAPLPYAAPHRRSHTPAVLPIHSVTLPALSEHVTIRRNPTSRMHEAEETRYSDSQSANDGKDRVR